MSSRCLPGTVNEIFDASPNSLLSVQNSYTLDPQTVAKLAEALNPCIIFPAVALEHSGCRVQCIDRSWHSLRISQEAESLHSLQCVMSQHSDQPAEGLANRILSSYHIVLSPFLLARGTVLWILALPRYTTLPTYPVSKVQFLLFIIASPTLSCINIDGFLQALSRLFLAPICYRRGLGKSAQD